MKNGDVSSVNGNHPEISQAEYERHILRNAELACKALGYTDGDERTRKYHLFITLMIPIVMMADWIGNRDALIELFLRNVT